MNIRRYKILLFLFCLMITLADGGNELDHWRAGVDRLVRLRLDHDMWSFGLGTVSPSGANPSTQKATHPCGLVLGRLMPLASVWTDPSYLDSIKHELQKKWPHNRTINLVFHGHSVPTGYRKTPVVNRFDSYPFLTLKKIKEEYPFAVVNVITTSIGGEQAEQGAKRMKEEVLPQRPDVLFIDYALNDRSIGLERAKSAWEKMIKQAIALSLI